MRRARVVLAHRAPDRPPIRVARGDTVTLGDRDTEWPQFVWAAIAEGHGGWMPVALFDGDRGNATALADYDTRELPADPGELLTLHHELAQWWWAENAQGAQGWIPARALELLDDAVASTDNMFD
ncbi:MAG TPA: SH3 domain-containing protein [Lysobacter sp.]